MGRYVPPDLEGTQTANQASGKGSALGARARKLKTEGILTVRFECPFPIWCTTCAPEQIIGQGVRFNAEKKKVGNYYSTPIWSFRVKHTVCGGWIEVRTDPKNAEYVVVEGGRRRDEGKDKVLDGEISLGGSEEERARLEKDGAFGTLEKKVEDKQILVGQGKRLEDLEARSRRDWEDPYARNRAIRKDFRVGRKLRKEGEQRGEVLKEKFGLGFDMVEETEEDAIRASLVQFSKPGLVKRERGLFDQEPVKSGPKPGEAASKRKRKKSAAEMKAEKTTLLAKELRNNTRAAMNPFEPKKEATAWQPAIKIIKPDSDSHNEKKPGFNKLVEYDSD